MRTPAQFQGSEIRTRGQSKISSFGFVFGVIKVARVVNLKFVFTD